MFSERIHKSWETEQNFSILFSEFFYYNRLKFLVIFINENDVIIMYETMVASYYFYFFYSTHRLLFVHECVRAPARAYTSGVSPLSKYRECYFHRDMITTLNTRSQYICCTLQHAKHTLAAFYGECYFANVNSS